MFTKPVQGPDLAQGLWFAYVAIALKLETASSLTSCYTLNYKLRSRHNEVLVLPELACTFISLHLCISYSPFLASLSLFLFTAPSGHQTPMDSRPFCTTHNNFCPIVFQVFVNEPVIIHSSDHKLWLSGPQGTHLLAESFPTMPFCLCHFILH